MWRGVALRLLEPAAAAWIARQERRILREGEPLSRAQLADAALAGVLRPELVRISVMPLIPPFWSRLRLVGSNTIGLSARYGIWLREDYRHDRRLLLHELAHTSQYERVGGIRPFLRQYLREWLAVGYPAGALETEAAAKAERLCA